MKPNKKIIRWGMIGCGSVTELKSAPAYKSTSGFELKAVMRRNVEKLEDYAKRHKIEKIHTNADELINDPEIDAIYIATPPNSHLFYALKVANAEKPCCIEKPLSPTYQESLKIFKAFETRNIPLFVAYYRRSLPRFEQVNQWLKEHKIGQVRTIHWQFSKPANETDLSKGYNWRTDIKIAYGGYFDDLASHGLDLFCYFFGNVKQAQGFSFNQQNLYTAKDAVVGSWIYENGITGSGNWNFGASKAKDFVQIMGSEGEIKFSIFQENPIVLKNATEETSLFIENPKHVQQFHVENLKRYFFEENFEHPSTGKSAMHTNWMMEQILNINQH